MSYIIPTEKMSSNSVDWVFLCECCDLCCGVTCYYTWIMVGYQISNSSYRYCVTH